VAWGVDTVVVYKIDRLTRSLADFAKIVEILDARGASFVSVTQQFNTTTSAQLIGHGGPVRALAVSEDGATAFSGSFDASAIRWSLDRGIAEQVMRLHDNAVNALAILRDGRAVTGGADARIAIWTHGSTGPDTILEGHTGPIAALAISPDGTTLASASWDCTVRLWPLAGGAPAVFEGHQQNVNAVAFAPNGKALVSAGYDATVRLWPLSGQSAPAIMNLAVPRFRGYLCGPSPVLVAGPLGEFGIRLTELADRLAERGLRLAYHHHMGTVVETPAEIDRLMAATGGSASCFIARCRKNGAATWSPLRRPLVRGQRNCRRSRLLPGRAEILIRKGGDRRRRDQDHPAIVAPVARPGWQGPALAPSGSPLTRR
jgi:hypothetical protein